MKTSHPEEDKHVRLCQKPWIARVAADLLKTLAILLDTTVRKIAVDRVGLKLYWKSEKGHISLVNQQFYYLQFFKRPY